MHCADFATAGYNTCMNHGAVGSNACPLTCGTCPNSDICQDSCDSFFRDAQNEIKRFQVNNGKCEDGGPNSEINSGSEGCPYGSDCQDCGPRSHEAAYGPSSSTSSSSEVSGQSIDGVGTGGGVAIGVGVGIGVAALGFAAYSMMQRKRGRGNFKGMNEGQ